MVVGEDGVEELYEDGLELEFVVWKVGIELFLFGFRWMLFFFVFGLGEFLYKVFNVIEIL